MKDYRSRFNHLRKMYIQKYSMYLPTAFDESPTLLEKVNILIERINDVVNRTNDLTDFLDESLHDQWELINELKDDWEGMKEWLLNEGLENAVSEKLTEWYDDGLFSELFNNILLKDKPNRNEFPVNLLVYKDYKVGNNWTNALKEALKDNKHIVIPEGEFEFNNIDIPYSDTIIEGQGEKTVLIPLDESLFSAVGVKENEINITSDIKRQTNIIYVDNVNGLNPLDYILIKGQRDCLNEQDSGQEWTIGNRTSSTHLLHFGEFLQIHQIEENRLETNTKTIFPNYLHNNSQESSDKSRERSTIQRILFKENIHLKNFKISHTMKRTLNFTLCNNCTIENVKIIDKIYEDGTADFIYFEESLNCKGINCYHEFYEVPHPEYYYSINIYKIRSSQLCGFEECYTKNGGQPFDISYMNGSIPSSMTFTDRNTIINAQTTGITTHGGTFNHSARGNNLWGCSQGINIRTRNSNIIGNNVVVGSDYSNNSYGIAMYDKWAVDCTVTGNTIIGYKIGIAVADSSNYHFAYIGSVIANNTIKDYITGIYLRRSSQTQELGNTSILIQSNTMTTTINDEQTTGIHISKLTHGFKILDNNIRNYGVRDNARGIYVDNNSSQYMITGNSIANVQTGVRIGSVQESVIGRNYSVGVVDNNHYINVEVSENISNQSMINQGYSSAIQFRGVPSANHVNRNSLFVAQDNLYFKDYQGNSHIIFAKQE